jgi:hypothetical protein
MTIAGTSVWKLIAEVFFDVFFNARLSYSLMAHLNFSFRFSRSTVGEMRTKASW